MLLGEVEGMSEVAESMNLLRQSTASDARLWPFATYRRMLRVLRVFLFLSLHLRSLSQQLCASIRGSHLGKRCW